MPKSQPVTKTIGEATITYEPKQNDEPSKLIINIQPEKGMKLVINGQVVALENSETNSFKMMDSS